MPWMLQWLTYGRYIVVLYLTWRVPQNCFSLQWNRIEIKQTPSCWIYNPSRFFSTTSPSPPGVRHSNIICDSCKKHGIMGMRWKCKVCFDYDLCTQCYMNNKHDLSHAFERYETAHSQPWVLHCHISSTIDPHLNSNYLALSVTMSLFD